MNTSAEGVGENCLREKALTGDMGAVASLLSKVEEKTFQLIIKSRSKTKPEPWVFYAEAWMKKGRLLCFKKLELELESFVKFYLALGDNCPAYFDGDQMVEFLVEHKPIQEELKF